MLNKNYNTMKNFITFIIIAALSSVMFSGCAIFSKNTFAGSYVEEGTGYSMKKDIAFNMAVHNALAKISNEHSSSVNSAERQLYTNVERSRGRAAETFTYESNGSTKSNAQISDYKIVRRWYYKRRGQWRCIVTVAVEYENVV